MDKISQQLGAKLIPQFPGLRLDQLEIAQEFITIRLTACAPKTRCPSCATASIHIHSCYARTLADLPWAGYMVRLQLTVRKFFCKRSACVRRIFTERLPELAAPYARRSARLSLIVRLVGLALGGQGGARIMTRLGMAVSSSTLLRHIRRTPFPSSIPSLTSPSEPSYVPKVPRVLGIDDFAFRKGRTYGTILIDLEQHRPIDLLPDRTAETLAKWLREHPGIEIISRDRSTEYKRGATLGAPQALQVADRFHIVKNMREAIERLLDRNRSKLTGIQLPRVIRTSSTLGTPGTPGTPGAGSDTTGELIIPIEAARRPARRSPAETISYQLHRVERQQRYAQVNAMHGAGESIRSIARQLGMSRSTVYHYLRSDQDPMGNQGQGRSKPSLIDPYLPYLYRRWLDGCENAAELVRELREKGYTGSRKMVATWVRQRRRVPAKTGPRKYLERFQEPETDVNAEAKASEGKEGKELKELKSERTPSSIQFSYFLMREPASLTMEEQAVLMKLKQVSEDVAVGYLLLQEFLQMMRQRKGEELNNWLSKVRSSKLIDLHNFAAGIERDKIAVTAGLSETWSNGQTEGQVHRLKLKKRQMYGRAKFDLLRYRVLEAV